MLDFVDSTGYDVSSSFNDEKDFMSVGEASDETSDLEIDVKNICCKFVVST